MKIFEAILALLRKNFPDEVFSAEGLSLMHRGRFANALVFRYRDGKRDWVIKDFSQRLWFIRFFYGRWQIGKEFRTMALLRGLSGTTAEVFRLGAYTVAYDFIGGESLADCGKKGRKLPAAFFERFEELVGEMHERGVAHLDLRNMGNVLAGADGAPHFIDFQSAMLLRWKPGFLKRLLRSVDVSAVYKAWSRHCETALPEEKRVFLEEFNRMRKFWVLRGYPLSRALGRRKK